MKPIMLFRLAAIVLFLQATGHTLGGVILYHAHTPAEAEVISAMQASRIDVRGATRSLWDFYYGFGLAVGFLTYVLAGVAWAAGRLARRSDSEIGLLALCLVAGCLSQALLCVRYFFALPIILNLTAALLCGAAWWVYHRRQDSAGAVPA
jgi:hypothetical protein